jgi:hypothetical protein
MTVLMTSNMPGLTQEGYDRLAAALLPVLRSTDGFIAHAAGPIDGGFLVTELWESEDAHDVWFTAHVAPAMPDDAPTPDRTIRPVVNVVLR